MRASSSSRLPYPISTPSIAEMRLKKDPRSVVERDRSRKLTTSRPGRESAASRRRLSLLLRRARRLQVQTTQRERSKTYSTGRDSGMQPRVDPRRPLHQRPKFHRERKMGRHNSTWDPYLAPISSLTHKLSKICPINRSTMALMKDMAVARMHSPSWSHQFQKNRFISPRETSEQSTKLSRTSPVKQAYVLHLMATGSSKECVPA